MKVLYCFHADTVSSVILGCYGYLKKNSNTNKCIDIKNKYFPAIFL